MKQADTGEQIGRAAGTIQPPDSADYEREEIAMTRTRFTLKRRTLLVGGAAALANPYIWSRPACAARQVAVRNPGGAYSDAKKQYIYDPFTKETGIEVVIVASTRTKMLAMAKSGNAELDVADAGFDGLTTLDHTGALAPIDYTSWKHTDAKDVPEEYVTPTTAGLCLYATVLGYNKETYPEGKQPKSWAEFWDAQKFPGARMLAHMASGSPNLEFALIADGVPMTRFSRSISTGRSSRCRGSSHTSRNPGIPAPCRRKCWLIRRRARLDLERPPASDCR